MRNAILGDFPGKVDFRPNDNSYLMRQIESALRNNGKESILIGALHGDLVKLEEDGALRPLDGLFPALKDRGIDENLTRLGLLNGKDLFYIPWMQATFLMAANKKALQYLPEDVRPDTMTYQQLEQWAKNIFEKTGRKVLGFPAGDKGLLHRFFQGYLYPSFTGSTLLKFRSLDAMTMWRYFKSLWKFVHPGSISYSVMAQPLLTGDVWIAWDHTARLVRAFEEKPDDFVAFPAPIGPKGRGYMAVISGLAIPKGVLSPEGPAMLVDYLTHPVIQERTLRETGFFPVVSSGEKTDLPPHLRELGRAVAAQADSPRAVLTLLPVGLGERAGDYNSLFMQTFSEILLGERDIPSVLNSKARELQKIIDETNAKSWAPDVSGERPCKIE